MNIVGVRDLRWSIVYGVRTNEGRFDDGLIQCHRYMKLEGCSARVSVPQQYLAGLLLVVVVVMASDGRLHGVLGSRSSALTVGGTDDEDVPRANIVVLAVALCPLQKKR